jgi:hypothetical protein
LLPSFADEERRQPANILPRNCRNQSAKHVVIICREGIATSASLKRPSATILSSIVNLIFEKPARASS